MTSTAKRILIGIVGAPSILFIVYLGGLTFAAFILLLSLLMQRELYGMMALKGFHPSVWIGYGACGIVLAIFYFGALSTMWLALAAVVITSLIWEVFRRRPQALHNLAFTLLGIFYIPLLFGTLVALRELGPAAIARVGVVSAQSGALIVALLFVGVWACDTAAYFGGGLVGRHPLIPRVSPGKTVEGSLLGLAAAVAVVFAMRAIFLQWLTPLDAVFLAFITGGVSQVGDLVESLLKRDVGVKDSSSFLPGHGGVLDRFDAMIIAAPVAYIYMRLAVFSW